MNLPISRRSLVDDVIAHLRKGITSGRWPVGTKLPAENDLCEELNVGRNTVREAVRALTHGGMLEVRQGDGTYMRSLSDRSETMRRIDQAGWRDHVDLLCLLEAEVARFAAMRRTDSDMVGLESALKRRGNRSSHRSDDAFYKMDRAFHFAVAKASHNVALEELYRFFSDSSRERLQAEVSSFDTEEPGYEDHKKLVDAIRQANPNAAIAAARAVVGPLIERASCETPDPPARI
jgi:DNA-binding FadR family transcriptional regulator